MKNFRVIEVEKLKDIQNLKSIIGKRVYNEEFVDEEGQTRVRLIIE